VTNNANDVSMLSRESSRYMGNDMTKKVDDGFTGRVLMALVSAMADRNYKDAKEHVLVLAKEHGVGTYAERVMAQSVRS
jgi:hypothetical protein